MISYRWAIIAYLVLFSPIQGNNESINPITVIC